MVAQGLRLLRHSEGSGAKPPSRILLRTSRGCQSLNPGPVQPILRPTPEFATRPPRLSRDTSRNWSGLLFLIRAKPHLAGDCDGPQVLSLRGSAHGRPALWPGLSSPRAWRGSSASSQACVGLPHPCGEHSSPPAIGRVEGAGRVVQRPGRRRGTAGKGERQGGYKGDANMSHGPSVPRGGMAVQGATSPDEKGAAPKDGPKVREEGFTFGRYG